MKPTKPMSQKQRHRRALALLRAAEKALSVSAPRGDEWAPDRAAWRIADALVLLVPDLDPTTMDTVRESLEQLNRH